MEEAKQKLAAMRAVIGYNGQSLTCSLGTKDCARLLVLIGECEAALREQFRQGRS